MSLSKMMQNKQGVFAHMGRIGIADNLFYLDDNILCCLHPSWIDVHQRAHVAKLGHDSSHKSVLMIMYFVSQYLRQEITFQEAMAGIQALVSHSLTRTTELWLDLTLGILAE